MSKTSTLSHVVNIVANFFIFLYFSIPYLEGEIEFIKISTDIAF